jgi:hypothetical protein
VTALINSLAPGDELSPGQRAQIAALPPEAIDPILAYHPWPDSAWQEMIRPFLIRHAAAAHKPMLLERLATDARLGSVFIEKGWPADAIPVLRRRAIERLPLDAESLKLLAEQNDPSLTPHLAALAIPLWGIEKIAPALRECAGFDWPSFVALGWKRHKYLNYDRQGWHYAGWAAELGDASAMRRLAEEAGTGKKWEKQRLAGLVDSEGEDLSALLQENLDRMTFDAATQKWRK